MTWHCHTAVATGGREKEGAPPPALRLMLVLVPPSHQTERIILQGGQQCVDKDTKRGYLRHSTVLQLPMPKTLVGAPTHHTRMASPCRSKQRGGVEREMEERKRRAKEGREDGDRGGEERTGR